MWKDCTEIMIIFIGKTVAVINKAMVLAINIRASFLFFFFLCLGKRNVPAEAREQLLCKLQAIALN